LPFIGVRAGTTKNHDRADIPSLRGTLNTHIAGKVDPQVPSIMSYIET
jgi:hypothetical protein